MMPVRLVPPRRWLLVLGLAGVLALVVALWSLASAPATVFSQEEIVLERFVVEGEEVQVAIPVRWSGPGELVIDKVEDS